MSSLLASFPIKDGYVAPAEWSEHVATLALWPERFDVWRDKAKPIEKLMTEIINEISKHETVYLGVSDAHFK
jgi:agmatine/peptidylarginine deiminase